MSSKADFFLKKALGEDFFQSLAKFELWKPGTRTTVDHEEIKTALKIVPRTIMSLLIAELAPMALGDTKEIVLPVPGNALMKITKHERDVYSGDITEDNKIIVDFKYRSIPGVGLVVMSAFELYNVEKLQEGPSVSMDDGMNARIQALIDERLALHSLVGKVVEHKIQERDAIQQLLLAKITDRLENKANQIRDLRETNEKATPKSGDEYMRGLTNGLEIASSTLDEREPEFMESKKKKSPLGDFLNGRKEKLKKNEYAVQMSKSEHVHCPDCGKNIFDGKVFAGCICYGDDMDKKIYMTKSEKGVKVRFGKGWDSENIQMFLEILRSKRG